MTKKISFLIIFLFTFVIASSLIWFFWLREKSSYLKKSSEELKEEIIFPSANEFLEEDNSKTDYPVIIENKALPISSFRHLDTKDWLTFTSERYKFSVKYPPDWKIEEKDIISSYCTREQADPIGRTIEECKEALSKDPKWEKRRVQYYVSSPPSGTSSFQLTIRFKENPERLSINDWIKQDFSLFPAHSSITCLPIISNDIEALACEYTSNIEEEKEIHLFVPEEEKTCLIYTFYLTHNDLVYIFSLGGKVDVFPNKETKQMYETIFSTFTIQE